MKPCLDCERPAAFSVCTVISTLGTPGRRQSCTVSLPFCASCLQRVCAEVEGSLALQIREALRTALRVLTEQPLGKSELKTRLNQKNNGVETEKL